MDVGVRRPGEEEEADGGAEHREEGGLQSRFLRPEAVFLDVGDQVEVEVGHVDRDPDQARHQDAQEHHADLAEREAVEDRVHQREDLEEGVVNPVDDRGVEVDEGDGRIFDGDLQGFDQGRDDDGSGVETVLVDFRLRAETVVPGPLAESDRPSKKDVGGGRLGHAEEHGHPDGPRDPDDLPERPAPAFGGDGVAGEQRPQRWPTIGCGDPHRQGIRQSEQRVHILHGGASVGQARTPEETLQEPQHQQTGEVFGERGRDRQDDEEGKRHDVDRISADSSHLAHGRKKERADAISKHVERQRQRSRDVVHPERFHDPFDAWCVDG